MNGFTVIKTSAGRWLQGSEHGREQMVALILRMIREKRLSEALRNSHQM